MTPLKLYAFPGKDGIPPYIKACTISGKDICILSADGTVNFQKDTQILIEGLAQIVQLQEHFFTLYNSLIEKDEKIRELSSNNPVIELYEKNN